MCLDSVDLVLDNGFLFSALLDDVGLLHFDCVDDVFVIIRDLVTSS